MLEAVALTWRLAVLVFRLFDALLAGWASRRLLCVIVLCSFLLVGGEALPQHCLQQGLFLLLKLKIRIGLRLHALLAGGWLLLKLLVA